MSSLSVLDNRVETRCGHPGDRTPRMVVIARGWWIVIAGIGRRVGGRSGVGVINRVGIRIGIGDGALFGAGRKGQQDGGEND